MKWNEIACRFIFFFLFMLHLSAHFFFIWNIMLCLFFFTIYLNKILLSFVIMTFQQCDNEQIDEANEKKSKPHAKMKNRAEDQNRLRFVFLYVTKKKGARKRELKKKNRMTKKNDVERKLNRHFSGKNFCFLFIFQKNRTLNEKRNGKNRWSLFIYILLLLVILLLFIFFLCICLQHWVLTISSLRLFVCLFVCSFQCVWDCTFKFYENNNNNNNNDSNSTLCNPLLSISFFFFIIIFNNKNPNKKKINNRTEKKRNFIIITIEWITWL